MTRADPFSSCDLGKMAKGGINTIDIMGEMDLANNELVRFIDKIMPFFQLSLQDVKEAIAIFNQKKGGQSSTSGDMIQMCTESIQDCLHYFPTCKDVVCDLMTLLCINKGSAEPLVRLIDVLIAMTITSRGRMKEKSELLYSLFAVAEPEGMLEYEHAGFIYSVACCLKSLGALQHLDLTEEDAAHLAFLARIKTDKQGFHPSLSFSQFFRWVQNSTESNVIFTFVRDINRLLEICVSMTSRVEALSVMLNDITLTSDKGIAIPKLNATLLEYVNRSPYLSFMSSHHLSFLLPAALIGHDDLYLDMAYVHWPPRQRYELTKRLKARLGPHGQPQCCEKSYRTHSRRKVRSAPNLSLPLGSQDRVLPPSIRIDIMDGFHADADYILTFYSSVRRFPPLLVRPPSRPPSQGLVSLTVYDMCYIKHIYGVCVCWLFGCCCCLLD